MAQRWSSPQGWHQPGPFRKPVWPQQSWEPQTHSPTACPKGRQCTWRKYLTAAVVVSLPRCLRVNSFSFYFPHENKTQRVTTSQQWREEDKVKWGMKKPWIGVKGEAREKNDHVEQMSLGDGNLSYAPFLVFFSKFYSFWCSVGPISNNVWQSSYLYDRCMKYFKICCNLIKCYMHSNILPLVSPAWWS